MPGKPIGQQDVAACYCRVSTDRQGTDGWSLGEQEARTKAICQGNFPGYKIKLFADTSTGRNDKRPAYRSLMGELAGGAIAVIVCVDLDRISRNVGDFLRLLTVLNRHGVGLYASGQGLDTTAPIGRLFAIQLMAFAEFESAMISERVKRGLAAARREGKKGPGLRPFGWDVDQDGNLSENQHEQKAIRLAAAERLRGSTWARISEILNSGGWRTVKGGEWYSEQCRSVMMTAIGRSAEPESRDGGAAGDVPAPGG